MGAARAEVGTEGGAPADDHPDRGRGVCRGLGWAAARQDPWAGARRGHWGAGLGATLREFGLARMVREFGSPRIRRERRSAPAQREFGSPRIRWDPVRRSALAHWEFGSRPTHLKWRLAPTHQHRWRLKPTAPNHWELWLNNSTTPSHWRSSTTKSSTTLNRSNLPKRGPARSGPGEPAMIRQKRRAVAGSAHARSPCRAREGLARCRCKQAAAWPSE
jgi:hypothetical protein